MHSVLDDLLVGAVLVVSVAYAAYSLGPRTLRRRAMLSAAILLRKLPGKLSVAGLRLEATASQKAAGSCGGCDSCGSAQSAAGAKSAPATAKAAPEVRIPVSTIRRR